MGLDKNSPSQESIDNADMLSMLLQYAPFSSVLPTANFSCIIDANIIIADMRYCIRSGRDDIIKLRTLQLCKAGILELHAPTYLKVEINKKISEKWNPEYKNRLDIMWKTYQKFIVFHDVGHENNSFSRDPKDAPYILLQKKISLKIISNDKDMEGMGASSVNDEALLQLNHYLENVIQSSSLEGGSLLTLTVCFELAQQAMRTRLGVYALGVSIAVIALGCVLSEKFRKIISSEIAHPALALAKNALAHHYTLSSRALESKIAAEKMLSSNLEKATK